MEYEDILKDLAPCGLSCRKCLFNAQGLIKEHSIELQKLLGSFDRYAERFSKFVPVFNNYPAFKELLSQFTKGGCNGCRNGECKYPNCGVAPCYKTKGVDFCFQCGEFPCEKSNFDPDLKRRWLDMNTRMKGIGVKEYYEETKDTCRYVV